MIVSSFACSLMLIFSQTDTTAIPVETSFTSKRAVNFQEGLQRREIPMKISDVLKPENHHLQVKVQQPKRKSLMHKISDTINNKPFLAFSAVMGATILANTAVIGAAIHEKERRVMLKKKQKGELPVALTVPKKAPEKVKTATSGEVEVALKKDDGGDDVGASPVLKADGTVAPQ